jgi:hypothetical protein
MIKQPKDYEDRTGYYWLLLAVCLGIIVAILAGALWDALMTAIAAAP